MLLCLNAFQKLLVLTLQRESWTQKDWKGKNEICQITGRIFYAEKFKYIYKSDFASVSISSLPSGWQFGFRCVIVIFQHRKCNRGRTIKRGKKKRGQENSRELDIFFVSWTSFKHAFIIGDRQRSIKWTCPFNNWSSMSKMHTSLLF